MEAIPILNQRLIDYYGIFEDGSAIWRIVWSDNQYEIRYGTYTKVSDSGLFLGEETGYKEVPKYKQWIQHKWVLERLIPVPDLNNKELITKLTYEPVWAFQDSKKEYLPADWDICTLVIDAIYTASARAVGMKYKDPDSIPEEERENSFQRIKKLQEELFGNETEVGDALAHKQAIVVP